MNRIAIIVAVSFFPVVAVAHPDHGAGGSFGLVHLFTDPFHLGLMVVTVATLAVVRRWILRRE